MTWAPAPAQEFGPFMKPGLTIKKKIWRGVPLPSSVRRGMEEDALFAVTPRNGLALHETENMWRQ